MALVVALALEPRIDLAVFGPACEQLTGVNPVRTVDAKPGKSTLVDQFNILENFSQYGFTPSLMTVGFLVAGPLHEVNDFIELTGGLHHTTAQGVRADARAILIIGSLVDWKAAIFHGTQADVVAWSRQPFLNIMDILKQRGFESLFSEFRTVPQSSGVPLLRLTK